MSGRKVQSRCSLQPRKCWCRAPGGQWQGWCGSEERPESTGNTSARETALPWPLQVLTQHVHAGQGKQRGAVGMKFDGTGRERCSCPRKKQRDSLWAHKSVYLSGIYVLGVAVHCDSPHLGRELSPRLTQRSIKQVCKYIRVRVGWRK